MKTKLILFAIDVVTVFALAIAIWILFCKRLWYMGREMP